MVPLRATLGFVLLLLAGCAQLPQGVTPPPTAITAPSCLSHVYVHGDDSLRPGAFADALSEGLREHGFEVRGAEGKAPDGDSGIAAIGIARTVAEGRTPPPNARVLAYLHPNAPRLLLLVDIAPGRSTKPGAGPSVRVGAIFANTVDGAILWSSHIEEDSPVDDRQLRRLADRLLATLPPPQS